MIKINTQSRWLAAMLLLVAAMAVPTKMWAEDIRPTKPSVGDGSIENPYQISNAEELYWLAALVNGDRSVSEITIANPKSCAKLMNDITVNEGVLDASGNLNSGKTFIEWTPIGNSMLYSGTFDGQGHTVSGLYFDNTETSSVGLFGSSCGTIQNVGVVDSYFNGEDYVGGVCGMNWHDGTELMSVTIKNCYNTGAVNGRRYVGGVCGYNRISTDDDGKQALITDCYNTGKVSGDTYVGGVCGSSYSDGNSSASIMNCYTTGAVSGNYYVGGVCGENSYYIYMETPSATIKNCYYNSDNYTGGAVGYSIGDVVDVMGKTTAEFASGEVAWLLNGGETDGTQTWYQNLSAEGGDASPVLTSTTSNTVYQVDLLCQDGDNVGRTYSNTTEAVIVEHIPSEIVTYDSEKKIYHKKCQREGCSYVYSYYIDAEGAFLATPNNDATAFSIANYDLQDATAYTHASIFTVSSLEYNRTFYDDKWMAVYVPFAIDCSQLPSNIEMAVINNFHEYEQENGSYNVVLEVKRETSATIPALTPCVMRMKTAPSNESEMVTMHFSDAMFSPAEDTYIDCSSVTRYYKFTGSLTGKEEGSLEDGRDFVLNEGKLYKANSSTVLLPQRWYLSATDRNSTSATTILRSISISVIGDSNITGIEDIHVVTEKATSERDGIFDLLGRRLSSEPTKGIYIKNGVKYVK